MANASTHSARLRAVVTRTLPGLHNISGVVSRWTPAPGKWSIRQILGHLVDSALHNHHRIVAAQLRQGFEFPGYDQDRWVQIQNYQDRSWPSIIDIWQAANLHIAHAVSQFPHADLEREWLPHTLDRIAWRPIPATRPATLDYLIRDYIDHLEHHLSQIDTLVAAAHKIEPPTRRSRK